MHAIAVRPQTAQESWNPPRLWHGKVAEIANYQEDSSHKPSESHFSDGL